MTATETFSTLRQFWLKHYDAMEVLIMDQGTEFGAEFQHLCQSREVLTVVTDLETPWQNSVVERHGALFKMAFEKACSLEAPTMEVEVNELIDFTFAELNRRVGRAGFSPGQRVFGRQLRLPSSLLEDDFIDPLHDRSGRHSRDAAKRGYANGSSPWVRSRRRPTSDVDSIPQSITEATAGTGGWRTRLHTQTEGWGPKMVCTWCVRRE